MSIYILNLVSIILYSLIFSLLKKCTKVESHKKNIDLILVLIIGFQLFLISAFRDKQVGIDLVRYIPRYRIIVNTDWKNIFALRDIVDFEYGYIFYNKIVGILFNQDQALLIVTSAIVTISFSYFIWKYSKIPWISFYLFISLGFWGSSFNILRQYIAIAIVLFSIQYIKSRRFFRFFICILVATTFHTTAIFFVILYPLYNIKIGTIQTILLACVGIVFGFTSEHIIRLIVGFTSYSKYFNDIGSGMGNGSGQGNLIVLILVIICVMLYRKNVIQFDDNTNLWVNMIIISIFINILAIQLGIFERVMRYFMIAMIIVIPNTLYSLKQAWLRMVAKMLVLALTSYYYFQILMCSYSASGGIVPYMFLVK